jgi:uncharacterized membrane protein YfcA
MTPPASTSGTRSWPALIGLGAGTNFLDALGVGSFATTTAWLRGFRVVDDEDLPGTLNVGHSIPTVVQCILYLIALGAMIDKLTLVSMVLAGGLGAWYGAGIVAHWPRRTIQRAMALALLVTAGFMTLRMLMSLTLDDGTMGLSGVALAIAVFSSLIIGSLISLGIGNYAPTMAVTYMLGMNQRAVFPIMAASAALMLPVAALRFYRSGRFDRRVATGLALGGIPGALVAVYVVKSLPLDAVRWIVVAVLLYTAATLYRSSQEPARTDS